MEKEDCAPCAASSCGPADDEAGQHSAHEALERGDGTLGLGRESSAGVVMLHVSAARGGSLSQHDAALRPSVSNKNRL